MASRSPRRVLATIFRGFLIVLLLLVVGAIWSLHLIWTSYDQLRDSALNGRFPDGQGSLEISFARLKDDGTPEKSGNARFAHGEEASLFTLAVDGVGESPISVWSDGRTHHLHAPKTGAAFRAEGGNPEPLLHAIRDAGTLLPDPPLSRRILSALVLRPFLSGVKIAEGELCWRVSLRQGHLWLTGKGRPVHGQLNASGWTASFETTRTVPVLPTAPDAAETVSGDELMLALAEAVNIAAYPFSPEDHPAEGITRSGKGWMEVRNGHRQLFLTGTPYEIGHQHGVLGGPGTEQMAKRLVYGVGLLYSIKQKEWFPAAARKLVERQRPFIQPDYFEEMRGLAEGSNVSLDLIQSANIFPEFFHCSGVALMGDATAGGKLLHARVLDYMVGIGLQDRAAVMAIERPGRNRFVTVGYLSFIGSVTGMNEKQVAIGEMGGAGQGDWDGIPMSLLIRQALEECNTLEEVEAFMRTSPRTCEYYYVISDGKGPKAIGVAATPAKFETFAPGEFHERLQQPVEHAVLLSGPGRYEKLVERVRADYGRIDRNTLIDIIKRPVSMRSNLHNVIFEPESLHTSVADASRNDQACNQPYRSYSWETLFATVPPSSGSAR